MQPNSGLIQDIFILTRVDLSSHKESVSKHRDDIIFSSLFTTFRWVLASCWTNQAFLGGGANTLLAAVGENPVVTTLHFHKLWKEQKKQRLTGLRESAVGFANLAPLAARPLLPALALLITPLLPGLIELCVPIFVFCCNTAENRAACIQGKNKTTEKIISDLPI